ncbi:transmembrane protein 183-like isoform X2 [Armigeres subalbatus]|uniref:transmembrane protein 183-like isoform X2 n=1 Tax=Armigeres subalbatus TaxID=124917 RepID=UPI002ED5F03D
MQVILCSGTTARALYFARALSCCPPFLLLMVKLTARALRPLAHLTAIFQDHSSDTSRSTKSYYEISSKFTTYPDIRTWSRSFLLNKTNIGMAVSVKIKSRSFGSSRDFSIYDFAHSGQLKGRRPKANVLAVDDCEADDAMDDEMVPVQGNQNGKQLVPSVQEEGVYSDYTIDIWFIISEFVRPEDVGRFALICRKTAEVVQSDKFWHHIYRRHYDRTVDLPRRLQPDFMLMLKGLRARTIRSLYYCYEPFTHRIAATAFTDPHRVTGRLLIFSWYTKCKATWNYYFKLKTKLIPGSRADQSARMQKQKDSLQYLQDTYANAEEGCQILIITTQTMHLLPQYHEQLTVKSFTQTLAQGFTNYKVRLQMANYCQRVVDEILFVPVRKVRVLDWWNPEYYQVDPTIEKEVDDESEPHQDMEYDADNVYWDD